MGTGNGARGEVLAVHGQGRHTLDLVVTAELLDPLHPHLNAEGTVGIGELLAVHTFLYRPFLRRRLGVEGQLVRLHRIENLRMQAGQVTGRRQRKMQLGQTGQLRIAPGAVIGWDMGAAITLGVALGVPAAAIAELLPGIEAVMVRKLNEQVDKAGSTRLNS